MPNSGKAAAKELAIENARVSRLSHSAFRGLDQSLKLTFERSCSRPGQRLHILGTDAVSELLQRHAGTTDFPSRGRVCLTHSTRKVLERSACVPGPTSLTRANSQYAREGQRRAETEEAAKHDRDCNRSISACAHYMRIDSACSKDRVPIQWTLIPRCVVSITACWATGGPENAICGLQGSLIDSPSVCGKSKATWVETISTGNHGSRSV